MASPLSNAIEFLKDFGLFDVVLPFLLVFTFVFAILEKTKILGTETDGKTPKKNLDAMVSFVFALLVVATNKIVSAINQALPNVVLLIVIFVTFLLVIGVFFKTGEIDFRKEHKGLYISFVIVSIISLILIFLDAIKTSTNESWLDVVVNYVVNNIEGSVISGFVFLIVVIFAIVYITHSPTEKTGEA